MLRDLRASIVAAVVITVLFGLAYPLAVTGVSQVAFPNKADGSRVTVDGHDVGSRLIGQDFNGRKDYFQGRPSATGYDPEVTFFNNLGPNSGHLKLEIERQVKDYLALEEPYVPGLTAAQVPVDAVTTSASGVDPHISQANARIQAHRIAAVRSLPLDRIEELISDNTDGRALGVLGEPGVNVLELNIALDKETK
jgi:potassium-transporting ATPase KdpC subunit